MKHGISSAFPSHVKIGHVCYDVIAWTLDGDGCPTAWYSDNGKLNWATNRIFPGTAAEAEARG